MAVSMDALLKIKADVSGEGAVQNLARGIGNLNKQAGEASKGFGGLLGSSGKLSGALQALIPLASAGGLAMMATNAINTADRMRELSEMTGVSVENLSSLDMAARDSGITIEDVAKALTKVAAATAAEATATLGKMGGAYQGSLESQVQMIEESQQKQVDAIKTAADQKVDAVRDGERRDTDAIQASADKQIDLVRKKESDQIDAIQDAADERQRIVEKESDKRLKEINRRYRQEEKLNRQGYDESESIMRENIEKQQRLAERETEQRFDAKRKQIENDKTLSDNQRDALLQTLRYQQEDQLNALRDGYKQQEKEESRLLQESREKKEQMLEDQKQAEEDAVKEAAERQKKLIEDQQRAQEEAVKASAKKQEKTIKDSAENKVAIVKEGADKQIKEIKSLAEAMTKALTDETSKTARAFKKLGVSLVDASGNVRPSIDSFMEFGQRISEMENGPKKTGLVMEAFGNKLGPNLVSLLNKGKAGLSEYKAFITTDFANSADKAQANILQFQNRLNQLAGALAQALMPALEAITTSLIGFADWFGQLPKPVQAVAGGIVALTAAMVALAPAISAVISIAGALAGLQLGATIAGWLGAVGPAIAGITAAFTGLLAWIGGTLIPGLLAFFSGPVGWTVLAVAAVVAMCIAFREPIGQFLNWFGEAFMTGLNTVAGFLKTLFIDPWIGLIENVLKPVFTTLWSWLQEAAKWCFGALVAIAYQIWVQPWLNLWNNVLRQPVTAAWTWLQTTWKQVSAFFLNNVVKPLSTAWTVFTTTIQNGMRTAANVVIGVWNTVLGTVRNVIRSFLQGWANAINTVIGLVNRLINTFNLLPGPDIGTLGYVTVPAFAQGGVVNRPTVGLVGEAGPEYIIPASKMASASQRFLAGARGADVLSGGNAAAAPAQINITTGPVIEMDGQKYVSLADLEMAMRITADSVMGQLRTPSARISLGLA